MQGAGASNDASGSDGDHGSSTPPRPSSEEDDLLQVHNIEVGMFIKMEIRYCIDSPLCFDSQNHFAFNISKYLLLQPVSSSLRNSQESRFQGSNSQESELQSQIDESVADQTGEKDPQTDTILPAGKQEKTEELD